MREEIGLRELFPRGECLDIPIGPQGDRLWESPWRHNLIAEGLRRMLAALVKGDPQGAPLAFWLDKQPLEPGSLRTFACRCTASSVLPLASWCLSRR
jgi:hypothetical protein